MLGLHVPDVWLRAAVVFQAPCQLQKDFCEAGLGGFESFFRVVGGQVLGRRLLGRGMGWMCCDGTGDESAER